MASRAMSSSWLVTTTRSASVVGDGEGLGDAVAVACAKIKFRASISAIDAIRNFFIGIFGNGIFQSFGDCGVTIFVKPLKKSAACTNPCRDSGEVASAPRGD